MKTRTYCWLIIILISTLACGVTKTSLSTPTPVIQETSSNDKFPNIPTLPLPASNATEVGQPCDIDKWHVLIVNSLEYPIGDGWKYIIAELALENSSTYWGKINLNNVIISTEDGFAYQPISGYF